MAVEPAEVFELNAGTLTVDTPADIAVFNLVTAAPINAEAFESMVVDTPFTGWAVEGKTLITFIDEALAWSEETW